MASALGTANERVSDERLASLCDGLNVWTAAGRSSQPQIDMDIYSALIELQQRRASVVTPEMGWKHGETRSPAGDLYSVHQLSGVVWQTRKNGTAFTGWKSTEEAAKAVAYADFATLSVVSHEAGDGETVYRCTGCGRLTNNPKRDLEDIRSKPEGVSCCPERNMQPVPVAELIAAMAAFPAPTDETQGVKREPVGYVREDTLGRLRGGYDGPIVGVPAFDTTIPLFSLSQLEAVERERDEARTKLKAEWTPRFDSLLQRAETAEREADTAEASLAAMGAALTPFVRHYETWMERISDADNMTVFPRHTMGELRAAIAALSPGEAP